MLADGFPLEFERQQVSTSVLNSFQYSDRFQQCSRLDGLHLFSYFQTPQSLHKSFGGCTERTNYNRCHRHFRVPWFFLFSSKCLVLISIFAFLRFHPVVSRKCKIHYLAGFFCGGGLIITRSGLWSRLGDPFISQNLKEFFVSYFLDGFEVVYISFVCMVKSKLLAQFTKDHLLHLILSSLLFFLR